MNYDNKYVLGHLDTPYHIGYVLMDESDTRRHKSRCSYYDKELKTCKHAGSPYYEQRCGSSSHCRCYAEDPILSPSSLPIFAPPPPDSIINKNNVASIAPNETHKKWEKYEQATKKLLVSSPTETPAQREITSASNTDKSITISNQKMVSDTNQCEVQRMNTINIEPIKQTLKSEFPKETDAIKASLINIKEQFDSITSSIGDLVKAGITGCDIKGSRELLNTYEPFINKIKFYKDEIAKCIDSLSK